MMRKKIMAGTVSATILTIIFLLAQPKDAPRITTQNTADRETSSEKIESAKIPLQKVNVIAEKKPADNDADKKSTSTENRVKAALERFEKMTAHINKDIIQQEQKKVAAEKERLNAIASPEPTIEEYTDNNGFTWEKLQYPDGSIRYELR